MVLAVVDVIVVTIDVKHELASDFACRMNTSMHVNIRVPRQESVDKIRPVVDAVSAARYEVTWV